MPCPVGAAEAGADLLDRDHERIGQQHGPADAEAKLRAGLAVGADAGWIVVRRPGDQPWPENADQAPDGTGFDRLIVFSL
jgi:electron transfer flavoprotein alpha/beta subunit